MKRLRVTAMILSVLAALVACGCGAGTAGKGDAQDKKTAGNVSPGPGTPGTGPAALLVSVKKVDYEKFEHFFRANGSVEAVEDAFISPELNARIKKIHINEGQRVKQGQLLVSLNSDVTESAAAEVRTALEMARTVYKKRKGLWDKKIGSEIQYLEAKTNKESLENRLKTLEAQLEMSRIKAPINGIVDKIFKKEGELAVPGMQLLQLVNLERVYIDAEVSEAYIASIGKGDRVEVTFPSYPGMVMGAVIQRTGQVVNLTNRTFLVRVRLDNKEEKLKPNMMAVIRLRDFLAPRALVVPSIIVKNDLEGPYVYVVEGEKGKLTALKVYIKPGLSEGSRTMIDSGLHPGRQVIVKGYNLVKNGMAVKIGNE